MSNNNWKKRDGIVFSTNPDFEYQTNEPKEEETLAAEQQKLIISLDKKARKGKSVTLISGFVGRAEDLNILAKYLKNKCGVGGSVKNGQILIQGDQRERVHLFLSEKKYKTKISGK